MFESGTFVAEQLGALGPDQPGPHGVDLTLDRVFEQTEPGRIGRDGKTVGDRAEFPPEGDVYRLSPGGYVVGYTERIAVPEGHVGYVYPRSSLLRNSCTLNTAVWEAGYEGRGEGLLEVYHPIEIEPGARIGQLVLAHADHEGTYDGTYQGEGLEE